MKKRRDRIILPESFTKEMEFISTIFNHIQKNSGILIMGENLKFSEKAPILRLYLLKRFDLYWNVQAELQAFTFDDVESVYVFVEDLPHMSALDLLVLMNTSTEEAKLTN